MISMLCSEAARVTGASLIGDDTGFSGCTTDSRKVSSGQLFIALRGEHFNGHDFVNAAAGGGAGAALVDEDVSDAGLTLIRSENTRIAMGRLAGDWRGRFDLPLIALTGSNGKTTVKEMLRAVLSGQGPVLATAGNLNNDIGVPLTLFGLGGEHHYAIIEMGANHAGEIDYLSRMARPTVALITQCAPAHLEGFESIEGVARAKSEIFHGLMEDGIAIINADDDHAGYWNVHASEYRRITFGIENDADVTATGIRSGEGEARQSFSLCMPDTTVDVNLALPGRHNVMNALAAAACCVALDIPAELVRAGLENVKPVKGRLQIKMTGGGTRILDDSYNANPASLQAALEVLAGCGGRRWLVLGDMGELGEAAAAMHARAGELAREHGVERLFATGPLSENSVRAFGAGAEHFDDTESLLRALPADPGSDVTILVKGSRAMAMDRIVDQWMQED